MKQRVFFFLPIILIAANGFCADYVYKTTEACAKGLSLTFSTASQENILSRDEFPLDQCTEFDPTAAGPDNQDGCVASAVVGKIFYDEVQLGSLAYANDQGQVSRGPISVSVEADLVDGSGQSEDNVAYHVDQDLPMLDTGTAPWGAWVYEDHTSPLNSLLPRTGLHKTGNQFTGLEGYADQLFSRVSSVNVYVQDCGGSVLLSRQQ